jgi:hypothetical protein
MVVWSRRNVVEVADDAGGMNASEGPCRYPEDGEGGEELLHKRAKLSPLGLFRSAEIWRKQSTLAFISATFVFFSQIPVEWQLSLLKEGYLRRGSLILHFQYIRGSVDLCRPQVYIYTGGLLNSH